VEQGPPRLRLALGVKGRGRTKRFGLLAPLFCVAGFLALSTGACAGSARDYLNAPVDTWLAIYNAGYTNSVTPEDGTDTVPGIRSNVFAQSLVLTRIMDYWGRTGGLSIVLPYAFIDTAAGDGQRKHSVYSRPRSRSRSVARFCKYNRLFWRTDPERTAVRRRSPAMDQAQHPRLQRQWVDGREAQTKSEPDAN